MTNAARLLLLLLLASCSRPAAEVPHLRNPGKTIVCLGDSITSGVGAEPGKAWPDLLAARLGVEVINAGVPGNTTEEGLARVGEALGHDPWLVIVELGGNDILRQVPPERTEMALRAILDQLLEAGVVPLLVEMEAPFAGRYNDVFARLADSYESIPVVEDTLGEILVDPALKSDPIHPNGRGHEVLAEAIAEEVEALLAARGKR